MADNIQNIPPHTVQQPVQPMEMPAREFVQVDTSTNAYMENADKTVPVTSKVLKDN